MLCRGCNRQKSNLNGINFRKKNRDGREKRYGKVRLKLRHIMADLNKYWALKEIKERCAPISIYECVLHTAFYEKDPWSLRPTDYGGWTNGKKWERVELPEEFWLISPDRKYKFDLREYYNGFVVSERFLSLLLSMEVQPFVYKEVFIVNKRKQSIIESKYYYIQFYLETNDLIDKEKSVLQLEKTGWVKRIERLCIREDVTWEAFVISPSPISTTLFVSEEFRQRCKGMKLIGIEFSPSEEAGLNRFSYE